MSDVRSNGARFVLEDGTVEARVEKVADAAWSVHAGPWEVRVTGTRFAVSWDARRSALRVALREGSVVVHGPGAESGIGLRAGQLLEAGDGGSIHVTSAPETPGAAAPGETRPRDAQDADQRLGSADPGGSSGGSTGPSAGPGPAAPGLASAPADGAAGPAALAGRPWPTRVAEGDYDGVLAEAESRGLDAVLGAAPAADLAALSDAARYRGRSGLATQALEALRGRFRGTSAAANASFLLGRMADDAGSASTAIRWYDAHLGEGGAFAAEALGRKMLAVRRSRGEGPAIPVAREYLARFPEGAYAPVARTLVGEGPAGAAPSGLAPSSPIGAPPPASGERGVMPTSP